MEVVNMTYFHGGAEYHKKTLAQVKAKLRKGQLWNGIVVGNKVNQAHFLSGWHLGYLIQFSTVDELEKVCDNMLAYMSKELVNRIAFYEKFEG